MDIYDLSVSVPGTEVIHCPDFMKLFVYLGSLTLNMQVCSFLVQWS